jgi:hypothetical protein
MDPRHAEYKDAQTRKGHGYNGFDPEHMTLDDVYEYYLLTGSWPAKSALRSAGEAMLTWRWVTKFLHTARSTGWTLRALVQVYRATGDPRYLQAASNMITMAEEKRGKGPVKYFHRGKADPRHIADKESDSPWMVAVLLHGLAAYGTESGDERVPPMLSDLTTFVMAGYRGRGFVSDLPVDGPLTGGEVRGAAGTSQWIPGALAAAAALTQNHAPVDRVYDYYGAMHANDGQPARFGSSSWHWWQPYLVSLQERHGRQAVTNPAGFRMPEPSSR